MLDRFKKDASRRLRGFSPDAIAAIHNYGWPGNVRKLINRVQRAIVMSEGRQITARDFELGEYVEVAPVSLAQAWEAAERQAIELALLRHHGRLGDAAHELGISRVTLYCLLSANGMRQSKSMPRRSTPRAADSGRRKHRDGRFGTRFLLDAFGGRASRAVKLFS